MTKSWRTCIVTLIDLIGVKKAAKTREASTLMRKLHKLVQTKMHADMHNHAHAYCWNDSVLLLAFWDDGKATTGRAIICEAASLKRCIDRRIARSYAVCVQGQTFPDKAGTTKANSRCVVLKTSSWAMANCFRIEEVARERELQSDWYVDSRLKKAVGHKPNGSIDVELLPKRKSRAVLLIDGYPS